MISFETGKTQGGKTTKMRVGGGDCLKYLKRGRKGKECRGNKDKLLHFQSFETFGNLGTYFSINASK